MRTSSQTVSAPPALLPVYVDSIPAELRDLDRWVVWNLQDVGGKLTKIPTIATDPERPASSTDASTWRTFMQALTAYEDGRADGVGYVLGDGVAGIDLDDCRDPETGTVESWATNIISAINSYTEISPSKTGVKIFVSGTLPPNGRRKGQIEMYDSGRYFTVTGCHFAGTPLAIAPRQIELTTFHTETFSNSSMPGVSTSPYSGPIDVDDLELLDRARAASNGDKFDRLFGGDGTAYPSISEADLALCSLLAFWTGRDHNRVDRLFRQSGLMREKWDQRRGSQTYGDMTIERAISTTTETWTPRVAHRHQHDDRDVVDHKDAGYERLTFPRTDAGNAELFAAKYTDSVRFDHTTRSWRIWKAHHWTSDSDGAIRRMAKATIRARLANAASVEHDEDRKNEVKWATQSESRRGLDALLALAESESPLAVSGDDWDRDPMLLGVANGILDLTTGALRDGTPDDRITKVAPVTFDPQAECPRWKRFVQEIFADHPELADYMQRVIGYSMTGLTTEQVLWILFGLGANGKSTFVETVFNRVFGVDLAWTMPFPAAGWGDGMSEYQKAALAGKRFVTSSEVARQGRLNEELIKSLTGGDTVTARHPYGRPFQFIPVAKFFLRVNDKPKVSDESHGMWRRIKLIPFTQVFPVDRTLAAILAAEAPGILQWAIQGCLDWQRDGLGEPAIVQAATNEYRTENDPLTEFISDCCIVRDGVSVRAGQLFDRFAKWAADHLPVEDRLTRAAFRTKVRAKFKVDDSGRHVIVYGVTLDTDGG